MLNLKNHPLAIKAHFEYSAVLTYAIPKNDVKGLLPPFLQFDLHNDEFAFFTIAIVKVRGLRAAKFPRLFGQDFHLVGCRFFVQYINQKGKRLRGLYILKSFTDSKQMVWVGNKLTHYKYEYKSIGSINDEHSLLINLGDEEKVDAIKGSEDDDLPKTSVFTSWKEARRFAGPLPFTFSAIGAEEVLIVEGVRTNWVPRPLEVNELNLDLSEFTFLKNARLSNAFIVENISYHWKKGVVEKWKR